MKYFKKISLFSFILTLIAAFSFTTSYAQEQQNPQPEMYKLTGKVVNAQSGEALSGIKVTIAGTELSATTDEKGAFTFDKLPAGTHTVTVEADGYQKWEKKVELNKDSELKIELTPQE